MRKEYFSVIRQSFYFLVVASMVLIVSAAAAETDNSDRPQVITGHVVDVDSEASELVVSYTDRDSNALVDATFSVPSDAMMGSGKQILTWDDIRIGDRVEVKFTGDPMDNPTAKHIIDLDHMQTVDER